MAETTLTNIIARVKNVVEAIGSFQLTQQQFTFEREPNATVDDRFWIEDVGLIDSAPLTGLKEARIDGLRVWLAKRLSTDSYTVQNNLETNMRSIERRIIADGPDQNYHAVMVGRSVQTSEWSAEVMVGSMTWHMDYDFDQNV